MARFAWPVVVTMTILITWATLRVQPQVLLNFSAHVWGFVFPLLALAAVVGVPLISRREDADGAAFLASSAYILGMLTSVVFGIYPYVLPASTGANFALTISNAKAPDYGLRVGLIWWAIGISLAASYFVFVYRHFAGRVSAESGK